MEVKIEDSEDDKLLLGEESNVEQENNENNGTKKHSYVLAYFVLPHYLSWQQSIFVTQSISVLPSLFWFLSARHELAQCEGRLVQSP